MNEKIEEYLMWKSANRPRAGIVYRKPLDQFARFCGEKDIDEYTIEDVTRFTNSMKEKYATESIRLALAVLKNFFRYYNAKKLNCLDPFLIAIPKKERPNSHRAITLGEIKLILSTIANAGLQTFSNARDFCIIDFFWNTGVRVSEGCSLNTEDIDLIRKRSFTPTLKTTKGRIIKWSDGMNGYLEYYLRFYKDLGIPADNEDKHPLFVSLSKQGKYSRLTSRSIQRIFEYWGKKAGVRKATPHTCRHGWAHVRCMIMKAPLPYIQKGLGHSSPVSTMAYQQFEDAEFEDVSREFLASPYINEMEKLIPTPYYNPASIEETNS